MKWYEFWKYPAAFRAVNNPNTLAKKEEDQPQTIGIPPHGGRSSVPTGITTLAPASTLTEIPGDFSLEWLATLENLCAYHPDVGYAMDNIVQLSNTPQKRSFPDKTPDSLQREMTEYLRENEVNWYDYSGGSRGLKSDLLVQAVVNGAISGEAAPADNLKRLDQNYLIPPKDIRFVWDGKKKRYFPYQKAPAVFQGTGSKVPGLIELNPLTYKYMAIRRIGSTPYALPPFLTAIKGILIKEDMLKNFSNMMEKLGMLGFFTVNVKPPEKKGGEQPEAYAIRCQEYLRDYVMPQMEKSMGKGIGAGFIGTHEFKVEGNTMNVTGADGLMKMVDSIIFAGLKQDPNMLGKNYSTTETFGRVILTKMLSQTKDYQYVTDMYYGFMETLALRLAGYDLKGNVCIESEQPLVGDRLKEAQAEKYHIDNVLKKRDEKIIDQTDAAQEMGYEKAADPNYEKAPPALPGTDPNMDPGKTKGPSDVSSDDSQANVKALTDRFERKYKKAVPTFPYAVPCCGDDQHSFDAEMGDDTLEAYRNAYLKSIENKYHKAIDDILQKCKAKFKNYTETTPVQVIQSGIYLTFLQYWQPYFVDKIRGDIKKYVEATYDEFRRDQSIFANAIRKGFKFDGGDDIPDAVFDLTDFRTIDYMENSDMLYMGKFITDEDTKKKLYDYIQKNYIDGHLPIGKGKEFVDDFYKEFKNLAGTESWKIRRIIDTTVVKARNYANIHYMGQAQVDNYEIVEAMDNLCCDYCEHMNGKKFSVNTGRNKIRREVDAGPERIASESPFATLFKIDEFRKLTNAELEAKGFVCPTFHPHCRGRVVADLKF